jgi:hypothetical protein
MPAPSAMTNGSRPKMNAKLVIITGRNRSRAPSIAESEDAFAGMALLDRELDDQNPVLGGKRDQRDKTDLRVHVEAQPGDEYPGDRAQRADADIVRLRTAI